jgi:hypothetical protein
MIPRKIALFIIAVVTICSFISPAYADASDITSALRIWAVIHTQNSGYIDAVWKKGGEANTESGNRVIWGYFYADPDDVSWGSPQNPEVFVKIWFDNDDGRLDVNFFHVSVPAIEVHSEYNDNGILLKESGLTTMSRRYIRQYYKNGQSDTEEKHEDGKGPAGYSPAANPEAYSVINNLEIGTVIRTVEAGDIEGLWRKGGEDITEAGDQVLWGYFFADPDTVEWGSPENPEVFVKVWLDHIGRADVNFFHVSVPDIEVYSAPPWSDEYDQRGTTILDNRYIRHEYCIASGILTAETPMDNCERPKWPGTLFTDEDYMINAWVHYCNHEGPKAYEFKWYSPEGELVRNNEGTSPDPDASDPSVKKSDYACSWRPIFTEMLKNYASGKWRVEFHYDNRKYWEGSFEFASSSDEDFGVTELAFTTRAELPDPQNDTCKRPSTRNSFNEAELKNAGEDIYAWADYVNFEAGKTYEFRWHGPDDAFAQRSRGSRDTDNDGCTYNKIELSTLQKHGTGQWRVAFYYNDVFYKEGYFDFE